ncbi:MAG: tRNA (guanosine(46)-N7)-methyltransferase TrmB [candidate division SR1 bacterium]|nr:tRNA (guanosine(46)-N7)-methyltransferase TrmB [candidate division SR1 bacterium]
MSRSKLKKFQEITTRKNVIEVVYPNKQNISIDWQAHFGNKNPIILELACGNGEYTNGLAALNLDKNYIGIDIKGERIWQASTDSITNNLTNAAFFRCQIDHLADYFEPNSVSEIWIIHPDPFLRESDTKKRLTSRKFLNIYRQFCRPNSIVYLKTDSQELFDFTLKILISENITPIVAVNDLYKSHFLTDHHLIITRFERKALNNGGKIYYIKFSLKS